MAAIIHTVSGPHFNILVCCPGWVRSDIVGNLFRDLIPTVHILQGAQWLIALGSILAELSFAIRSTVVAFARSIADESRYVEFDVSSMGLGYYKQVNNSRELEANT